MIVTVTLNPAVDKTIMASRVIMGTVNRMDEVKNMAGGKGINVSRVLKVYDYDVCAMGLIGGYNGQLIKDAVNDMGINADFTEVKGETRTSINLITEDGYITEFLEPGPMIDAKELEDFKNAYINNIKSADMIVISGSAPLGVDSNFYGELIKIADGMGKKVLLDTSGEQLKNGVNAKPFMIKPNTRELESLMGKRLRGMQEIASAAVELVEGGIPHVIVSMGNKGIIYAYLNNDKVKVLHVEAPSIKVINTVGSGDSVVAAFAMAYVEGLSNEDIAKRCVAVSASNATSLENGNIDKDMVEEFFDGLAAEELAL